MVERVSSGLITPAELAFIQTNGGELLYGTGMLSQVRSGITLDEAYVAAIADPYPTKHFDSYRRAKDFLAQHAGFFGISLED